MRAASAITPRDATGKHTSPPARRAHARTPVSWPSIRSVRLGAACAFALGVSAVGSPSSEPAFGSSDAAAPLRAREPPWPLSHERDGAFAAFVAVDAWESGLCLVDANGDADEDVAGIARVRDTRRATVIDGRSGEVVWSSALGGDDHVLCGDRDAVLIARADAELVALEARGGDERWRRSLDEPAIASAAHEGCVRMRLASGGDVALDLTTGKASSCAADLAASPSHGAPRRWTARDGDVELVLSTSEIGTSALTLEASRPGAAMWHEDLPLALSPSSEPFLAVRRGVVIVAAPSRDASDELVWVRRDLATGKALDERTEERRGSAHVFRAALGSRRVLAAWADGLAAYDPATGERLFRIGAR
jgi:outer membrane protein assembly factor BamB